MCSAKTQNSPGIWLVWSESLLSVWRRVGSLATHKALSKDWSVWTDAQADLCLCCVLRSFCWFSHAVSPLWAHSLLLDLTSTTLAKFEKAKFCLLMTTWFLWELVHFVCLPYCLTQNEWKYCKHIYFRSYFRILPMECQFPEIYFRVSQACPISYIESMKFWRWLIFVKITASQILRKWIARGNWIGLQY